MSSASSAVPAFRAKRAFLVLAAYVGAQVAAGVVAAVGVAMVFGVNGLRTPVMAERAARDATIIGAVGGFIVGGMAVYWLAGRMVERFGEGNPFGPFGWTRSSAGSIAMAVVAGAVLGALYLMALAAFPPPNGVRPGLLGRAAAGGGWPLFAWSFLAIVVAPPIEEFLFRGVLFTGFSRTWGPIAAGVIVTALFIVMHLTEAWGSTVAMLAIATVGVATLLARIKTGSLVPAIALHCAYNAAISASIFAFRPQGAM
ncbi:MAG: CPBP family intramembrane glutamic endopeptidase [Usitatibacter sp.]